MGTLKGPNGRCLDVDRSNNLTQVSYKRDLNRKISRVELERSKTWSSDMKS